ncbi:SDR family NAD(P)-dependent oxidoreductase, partial [bacterium]
MHLRRHGDGEARGGSVARRRRRKRCAADRRALDADGSEGVIKQSRGGRIINIRPVHEDVTMPTNSPYCASKGGVRMLMRTVAVELAPYGITVNDIAPGAIDTPMDAPLERDPT